uniref:Uncharacterized protein n=1 Tax=Oryza barthii TaxID=65489 RepID=A0A0D3FJZ7_9ORYZ
MLIGQMKAAGTLLSPDADCKYGQVAAGGFLVRGSITIHTSFKRSGRFFLVISVQLRPMSANYLSISKCKLSLSNASATFSDRVKGGIPVKTRRMITPNIRECCELPGGVELRVHVRQPCRQVWWEGPRLQKQVGHTKAAKLASVVGINEDVARPEITMDQSSRLVRMKEKQSPTNLPNDLVRLLLLLLKILMDERTEDTIRDEIEIGKGQIRHRRPTVPSIKPAPYGLRFIGTLLSPDADCKYGQVAAGGFLVRGSITIHTSFKRSGRFFLVISVQLRPMSANYLSISKCKLSLSNASATFSDRVKGGIPVKTRRMITPNIRECCELPGGVELRVHVRQPCRQVWWEGPRLQKQVGHTKAAKLASVVGINEDVARPEITMDQSSRLVRMKEKQSPTNLPNDLCAVVPRERWRIICANNAVFKISIR